MTGRQAWWFELDYPAAPPATSPLTADRVRAHVAALAAAAGVPVLDRCRVDVTWHVRTNREHTPDSLDPLLDAIYSGIGDHTRHVTVEPAATIHLDRACTPHFLVTITRLDGDA